MQGIKQIAVTLLVAATVAGCKKAAQDIIQVASLNVINASSGITGAKVQTPNVTAIYYAQISNVNYGSARVFTIPAGSSQITIHAATDTLGKPFYSNTVSANSGDIYSFFIGGTLGEDEVINKDDIPYRADSSYGVRFINMSPNSEPVHVALSTSLNTDEFSNISYKAITDFKTYGARSSNPTSYQFTVLDAGNNVLATSPTLSLSSGSALLNRNVTLVFSGLIGATDATAPKCFRVNNY